MPSMASRRSRFGAGILDGKIYVAGARVGRSQLNTAERFDPTVRKWEFISSMNVVRESCGLICSGGTLYAIGGYGSRTVEKYDPTTDTWIMATPMFRAHFGFGVATLDCPDPGSVIASTRRDVPPVPVLDARALTGRAGRGSRRA